MPLLTLYLKVGYFFNYNFFEYFFVPYGNLDRLSWVRRSSSKSSATHSCKCVQYVCMSRAQTKVWLSAFGTFNVCTDVDACQCTQGAV